MLNVRDKSGAAVQGDDGMGRLCLLAFFLCCNGKRTTGMVLLGVSRIQPYYRI